jgi:hypothetical protein
MRARPNSCRHHSGRRRPLPERGLAIVLGSWMPQVQQNVAQVGGASGTFFSRDSAGASSDFSAGKSCFGSSGVDVDVEVLSLLRESSFGLMTSSQTYRGELRSVSSSVRLESSRCWPMPISAALSFFPRSSISFSTSQYPNSRSPVESPFQKQLVHISLVFGHRVSFLGPQLGTFNPSPPRNSIMTSTATRPCL